MKIIRSSQFSLKFATEAKRRELSSIIDEYGKTVNQFIDLFWEETPKKAELLKPTVDKPQTWLSARLRKVAAREAIDMILSSKNRKKKGKKPHHYGQRMCVSSTIAELQLPKSSKEFDGWLHLASIGNKTIIDLPIRFHKHYNKLKSLGRFLKSFVITKNKIQVCFEIETGSKLEEGNVVGVDSGIKSLASCSDGEQYGQDINSIIEEIKRKKYGSNRQRKARRALRQRMDEVAKQVIKDKKLVVVEKLQKLNYKTRINRKVGFSVRKSLGAWCYRYWLARLQQQCESHRVAFRTVNPAYTSQRCHACGHTERGNRLSQEEFRCRHCGYADNADINAARNILDRFLTGPYGAGFKPKPTIDNLHQS